MYWSIMTGLLGVAGPGDVVLSDNRCVLHSATPSDLFAEAGVPSEEQGRRLIHRVSLPSPLPFLPAPSVAVAKL